MSNKAKTLRKILRCPDCENKVIIHRRLCKDRPIGHIKHMWCYKCKQVTGHIEEGREQ
jgi:hypothetical protein